MIRRREHPPPTMPIGPVPPEPKDVVDVREERVKPPMPAPAEKADTTVTVVGSGARLDGTLVSAASLRVEGSVKGQIAADGDVVIAPDAQVDADIRAANVVIGGRYTGNVTATGTLELTASAKVRGNISCRSLVVTAGAVFTGQSTMDGEAPTPESPKSRRAEAAPRREEPPASE